MFFLAIKKMNFLKADKKDAMITVNEIIGLLIVIIVIVAAAIPVVLDIINDATINITGVTKIVVDLIPLFLGLAALVATAKIMT